MIRYVGDRERQFACGKAGGMHHRIGTCNRSEASKTLYATICGYRPGRACSDDLSGCVRWSFCPSARVVRGRFHVPISRSLARSLMRAVGPEVVWGRRSRIIKQGPSCEQRQAFSLCSELLNLGRMKSCNLANFFRSFASHNYLVTDTDHRPGATRLALHRLIIAVRY